MNTGVANTELTAWSNANAEKNANADKDVTGNVNAYSSGIYGLYNDEGLIIAAVVIGEDAGSAKDLVYVHTDKLEEERDNASGSAKANYDDLWTWTRYVIRDGQEVLLTEVGDEYNADNSLSQMQQYHWYQVRTNADGHVTKAEEASVALAEYEKGETGASRYVITYSKIDDAVETTGVDTVLYLTDGGPVFGSDDKTVAGNGFDTELSVKGKNTLAVEGQTVSGIHFKNDVHVVLQYWNKNTKQNDIMEGEGVDDLKKMVDIVNDNNKVRDSNYFVSALIKDGLATDIVIYDSYNTYTRPGDVVSKGGNLPVALTNGKAKGEIEWALNQLGTLSATVTYTAPDFAAAGANVIMPATINVYEGNIMIGTIHTASGANTQPIIDGEAVFNYASDAFAFYGVNATNLTFRLSKGETVSAVKATYVDQNGNDITGKLTAQSNVPGVVYADETHNQNIKLAVDANKFTSVGDITIKSVSGLAGYGDTTGLVAAGTDVKQTNGSEVSIGTGGSNNYVKALGTSAVKVEVNVADAVNLPTKYDVKAAGSTAAFGKKLSTLNVVGLDAASKDKDAVLAITASPSLGADSVTEGNNVTYTVTLTGHLDGIITGYDVNYTVGGTTTTKTLNGHGGWTFTQLVPTVSADVDFVINSITANKVTFLMDDEDITISGDHKTLTIGFTSAIDSTIDSGNISGTKSAGSSHTINASEFNGKLVLVFSDALDDGDTINVDAAVFLKGLADTSKPDNRAKQAIITVHVTDGNYTFTVDSSV